MARIIAALAALTFLASCGGIGSSSLNPRNWFRSGPTEVEGLVPAGALQRQDSRPLVEEVTDIVVERVPGGAVVRARGRVAATGWFAADLVEEPNQSGQGVRTFSFRAAPPPTPVRPGGPASRVLVTGLFLSEDDLAGVSQIRVMSRTNIRTARR